ncbi:unnamed protein product [Paramecium octaurelia]|uniref:Uncharacterized protein n=1 Tax=Paramecium octaurelia TaxID=43137 RepID=A0A8S1W300_PAROT|nr:unnamed protein product [Paramecium octaurelia]
MRSKQLLNFDLNKLGKRGLGKFFCEQCGSGPQISAVSYSSYLRQKILGKHLIKINQEKICNPIQIMKDIILSNPPQSQEQPNYDSGRATPFQNKLSINLSHQYCKLEYTLSKTNYNVSYQGILSRHNMFVRNQITYLIKFQLSFYYIFLQFLLKIIEQNQTIV